MGTIKKIPAEKLKLMALETKLSDIRKTIIRNLKKLIGRRTLEVSNNDVFIGVDNEETLFSTFNSKGGTDEYGKDIPWKEISTDLLLVILKVLNKNMNKLNG